MKRVVLLGMVLLLLGALVWAAGGQGETAAKTIKVGYTAPFTGSAAEFGVNGWRGVQLALAEINQKGIKVGGETYQIEIVRYDSRCEPTEAVSNARKLILEDKVVAILGDHCSSCCLSVAPLCEEYKIPGITVECMADAITSPGFQYYFRMYIPSGLVSAWASPVFLKLLKPQNRRLPGDQRRLRPVDLGRVQHRAGQARGENRAQGVLRARHHGLHGLPEQDQVHQPGRADLHRRHGGRIHHPAAGQGNRGLREDQVPRQRGDERAGDHLPGRRRGHGRRVRLGRVGERASRTSRSGSRRSSTPRCTTASPTATMRSWRWPRPSRPPSPWIRRRSATPWPNWTSRAFPGRIKYEEFVGPDGKNYSNQCRIAPYLVRWVGGKRTVVK